MLIAWELTYENCSKYNSIKRSTFFPTDKNSIFKSDNLLIKVLSKNIFSLCELHRIVKWKRTKKKWHYSLNSKYRLSKFDDLVSGAERTII